MAANETAEQAQPDTDQEPDKPKLSDFNARWAEKIASQPPAYRLGR